MTGVANRLFYAMEAVLYLAYYGQERALSSRDIAAQQNLQPRYLEPIFQALGRAGIVISVRGPQGGYKLARPSTHISLADIARALEGAEIKPNAATQLGELVLAPVLHTQQQQWLAQLATITLDKLCANATKAAITTHLTPSTDFTI